jgi:hypothetical protein
MDYVSCSPFRVPIARLASAHAAVLYERGATSKSAKAKTLKKAKKSAPKKKKK